MSGLDECGRCIVSTTIALLLLNLTSNYEFKAGILCDADGRLFGKGYNDEVLHSDSPWMNLDRKVDKVAY